MCDCTESPFGFVHSKLLYKLGMIMKIILNLDPPNWTFKFIHLKNALNERKWSMFVKMNTEHYRKHLGDRILDPGETFHPVIQH